MFASRQGFTGTFDPYGNSSYYGNTTNANVWLQTSYAANLVNIQNTTGYTIEFWIYPLVIDSAKPTNSTIIPGAGYREANNTSYWTLGIGDNNFASNVFCLQYRDPWWCR
jgi:hypothetical protein